MTAAEIEFFAHDKDCTARIKDGVFQRKDCDCGLKYPWPPAWTKREVKA